VKLLLKNVPEEESVNVEALFKVLRGEKYGMQDFSFEVLLAAMIKQGLITGYSKEGEIFAPEELANVGSGSKALTNVLQTVEKGKMINFSEPWASVVKILNTLHPEARTTPYSTATQHTMWETAKKRVGEEKDRLDLTKQELQKLLESTGNQETAELVDPIETLLRVYEGINPNLDPKKGLEGLHEGVLKEYSDLDSFKQGFNQVEQLKDFCGKRRDNTLIDSYNYLKALIEGYEGLKNIEKMKRYLDTPLLEDLWGKFSQLKSLTYDIKVYNNFTKDYERFTESYAKAYAGSHTEYYTRRNTFNARLSQIKESKEYNALKLLSEIKKVRPHPSFEEVRKRLDQQLSTCEVKGLYGIIRGTPFCECGYKIGLEEKIPTTEETEETILKSFLSQVKMLQQKATKNRILTYANKEAIPILRKQEIQGLLEIGPSPENIEKICSLVSQEAVETISNALKDAVHISGEEIINELAGSYSLQEIAKATQTKIMTLAERKIKEEGKSVKDKDVLIVITSEG